MPNLIEEAFDHRDDGYGRAQKAMKRKLPKRFYRTASVGPLEDGAHTVLLDGHPTRTPGKVPVRVPHAGIAEIMAAEWNAQGAEIDPETMPVVRLINAAVEGGDSSIAGLRAEVIKYAGTDLLYYRAESPAELNAEQERLWDPVLTDLARHFAIRFETTRGIAHVAQPLSSLDALTRSLETTTLFAAAALALITGITGSGLLAIALNEGLIDPETAWQAAHVDEHHNMRLWGADSEAEKRLAKHRRDFDAGMAVLALVKAAG